MRKIKKDRVSPSLTKTSAETGGGNMEKRFISESGARAIIDASSDIFLLLNRDGRILVCNQTLAAQLGLKPDDIAGKCLFDFIKDEYRQQWGAILEGVFNTGKPVAGEVDWYDKTYSYSLFTVNNETGNVENVAVFAWDSTEQKSVRKIQIENEEIFRSFIEYSPVYVFLKDENIRSVRLSRNYESLLGLPLYELIGKTMDELFPAEVAEKMVADDLKVLREGQSLEVIEEFRGRTYSTIKFPVYIEGRPKYLAGYTMDITEQISVEKAIRESEERFRKVYAEGTMPIAMLNSNFRFISVNHAFQLTFGYSENELKGMTFKDITHPDHLQHDMENLNRLVRKEIDVYHTEKRYITRLGDIVWGNVQVSIVYDAQGQFMYFLVMIDNITDYKLAEEEIRKKNKQLEQINAEKDKFFSIIAHDLRSPFNSFLGLTEMMAEDLYSMPLSEIQRIATDMKTSAENLYRLLENLLEWSMFQRRITPFIPESISLCDVVNDSLMGLMEQIRRKSIRLAIEIPQNIRLVADKNMIATIFRNLISNAVKFTHKHGTVNIVAEKRDNASVEITIADSGIGMEQEMIESLFHLDRHNNRQGTEGEPSTGLGLILSKEFIEKHHGTIGVESEPGKGCRFKITFPAKAEPADLIKEEITG